MTQSALIAAARSQNSRKTDGDPSVDAEILVSVVMPCLNEVRTLVACIEQARAGCEAAVAKQSFSPKLEMETRNVSEGERVLREFARHPPSLTRRVSASEQSRLHYEIIIADNDSTDGSPELAQQAGARVISVEQRG